MKTKKAFFTVLISAIALVFAYSLINFQKTASNKTIENQATVTPTQTTEMSPEDVIEQMDGGTEQVTGPPAIEIISPEGDSFVMSQARMYKAKVSNLGNYKGVCYWKFYLNQYDEEELYREQETQVTGDDTCGFTSTFIDNRGELRVEVTLETQDYNTGDSVETVIDEATYSVL